MERHLQTDLAKLGHHVSPFRQLLIQPSFYSKGFKCTAWPPSARSAAEPPAASELN